MRHSAIEAITLIAARDPRVFVVTGDAGYGILDKFQKEHPDRFLNLGVAEQNMMGFCAGLAMADYRVFAYNIAPFILYRPYEQVRNDICYQALPVTLIGIGSGVTYAPGGMTHYSVEDIAVARTLPNLAILSPADPWETRACIAHAYHHRHPTYIRIAKTGEPALHAGPIASVAAPLLLRPGRGVALLCHGSISAEALSAADALSVRPLVLSVPMLQPLPFAALRRRLRGIHTVVTVEEHFVEGGLGSIIAEWIVRERLPLRLVKLGIANEFIHAIKDTSGMRRHYGISAGQIAAAVRRAGQRRGSCPT
ncbi:MAG: transketolase [Elusimicrobia bacterium]|nr:transketolase [Elusimicrobiota bacterium]